MNPQDATSRFYSLMWPHRAMVLRTARFLTTENEAEDLAQETLLKAFKSISQFDATTNAKAWLSAILRNAWIDRCRASGRQGGPMLSVERDEIDLPAGESAREGDVTHPATLLDQFSDSSIIRALRALPDEIRWTLLLVDVESMDHAAAAAILAVPEGTVDPAPTVVARCFGKHLQVANLLFVRRRKRHDT